MPTQEEYNLSKQNIRITNVRIELLDFNFNIVGELSGDVIYIPTFSINSNSDIRRTCSVTLFPSDSSFDIKYGNKIWIDKYIRVYVGQKNYLTDNITYTNMGIYLINNPSRTYDAVNNTLTFQGLDLMSKLTGLRNGNLEGLTHVIPQGSNVRTAIIGVLEMCGFNRYVVEECTTDVPNDIKIDIGGTAYQILKELRDIVPNYQIYFDVDGVFHYDKVPSYANENIMVDDDIWDYNLISYQKNTDFESLKNSIEVYGKTHDIKHYGTANVSDNKYNVTIDSISTLTLNTKFGFTLGGTSTHLCDKLLINNSNEHPILDEKDSVPTLKGGVYYVCKYSSGDSYWELNTYAMPSTSYDATISGNTLKISVPSISQYENNMLIMIKTPSSGCENLYNPTFQINNLEAYQINEVTTVNNNSRIVIAFRDKGSGYYKFLGEVTPHAVAKETNSESPFNIDDIGEIRLVLSGGEYDNIYSSQLAQERADWELYQHCRLLDSITITCIPIYWLDVNWLVSITLPNKNGEEETELYMINSINYSGGNSGTMTINMSKYYSFYDE